MTAVGGAIAADIGGVKIGESVDEIYVLVALCFCAQIGIFNDTHTLFADFGIGAFVHEVPVGLGSHDDGCQRLLFTEALIARVMRFFQMLLVGRVVVVIVDENAHLLIRDEIDDRGLSERSAGEAEIIYVRVEHTGDLGGVIHAGSARAYAVDDGGAVEKDGRFIGVGAALLKLGAFAESDVEVFNGGIDIE